MKKEIKEEIDVPENIECLLEGNIFVCRGKGKELKKKFDLSNLELKIEGKKIKIETKKGNKNELKKIKSILSHIKNMFKGIEEEFEYVMEACYLHFPMTIKVEKDSLVISNFLGEKVPRRAKIKEGVNVKVEGTKIFITSPNKEAAGETAGNIEKATKIKERDRRIFQDGIFIVKRPAGGAR